MFAIAITDNEWFSNVRSAKYSTANFWTPTPWSVRKLSAGDRWYFMRKSPIRLIGGYGNFASYSEMTIEDAWMAFGTQNGINDEKGLFKKIEEIASKRSTKFASSKSYLIGCIQLSDIYTSPDTAHVSLMKTSLEFPEQIVKFKYFNGKDEIAKHF